VTADARFADVLELTDEAVQAPLASVVLAYRAVLAIDGARWAVADALVERALSIARRGRTESHITSALAFALATRLALRRGDPALARVHLGEAQRLRPLLTYAVPWYSVGVLLELGEVTIGLGDPAGAGELLGDAEAVLRLRPGLGTLAARTEELRERLGSLHAAGPGSTLSTAELRILPLLVTHLPLIGVAERLSLSRHTVKSQVWSMYRKLGVHTRSDAIARARELGLIEG
jgi:LuxR family maltose regulon positive regulatory protein